MRLLQTPRHGIGGRGIPSALACRLTCPSDNLLSQKRTSRLGKARFPSSQAWLPLEALACLCALCARSLRREPNSNASRLTPHSILHVFGALGVLPDHCSARRWAVATVGSMPRPRWVILGLLNSKGMASNDDDDTTCFTKLQGGCPQLHSTMLDGDPIAPAGVIPTTCLPYTA